MRSIAVGNSRIGRAHQILVFSLHYGILYLSWETAMRCACNNYVAETNALPASSRELREIQIFFYNWLFIDARLSESQSACAVSSMPS